MKSLKESEKILLAIDITLLTVLLLLAGIPLFITG